MQAFTDTVTEPYTALVNNLYVYPLLLKYDSQKIFNKARNIACTVQFIASNERGGNSVKACLSLNCYSFFLNVLEVLSYLTYRNFLRQSFKKALKNL